MKVLVTGGAGYIGSHVVKELLECGLEVLVYDNLSNGSRKSLPQEVNFIQGDLTNHSDLDFQLRNFRPDSVMDFSGRIEVGESMKTPLEFYRNNVLGLTNLLEAMAKNNVKKIVYSSSASVYGNPKKMPISETEKHNPTSVYGETKVIAENMLAFYRQIYGIKFISLRYFNVSGADKDGDIGEDHIHETHLIPLVLKTALGDNEKITIYGTNYSTKDGTCIRDYVHVTDLAKAHTISMQNLLNGGPGGIYNTGAGVGYSVKEIINIAKRITGKNIGYIEGPRREGDPTKLISDISKIQEELGWIPKMSNLDTIIETAWNWHKNNPEGYNGK